MDKGKYVIFNHSKLVMFDGTFTHKEFKRFEYEGNKITSAGFFTVYQSKEHSFGIDVCTNFGQSYSLKIGPDKSDADKIKSTILGISLMELYL